jgi:hypothetical protein
VNSCGMPASGPENSHGWMTKGGASCPAPLIASPGDALRQQFLNVFLNALDKLPCHVCRAQIGRE